MMANVRLPARLGKEPLIDVVFGMSFAFNSIVEHMLPGVLLSVFSANSSEAKPTIEVLPIAQLPSSVRGSEPGLRRAPSLKISIDNSYAVLVGSRWLGISCLMPYRGWGDFKSMIEKTIQALASSASVSQINGYSLKYADFMADEDGIPALESFNAKVRIGCEDLINQPLQLKVEMEREGFVSVVTLFSRAARADSDGVRLHGALLDVDVHKNIDMDLEGFVAGAGCLLDEIHSANKRLFFELLSEQGLARLEPVYE